MSDLQFVTICFLIIISAPINYYLAESHVKVVRGLVDYILARDKEYQETMMYIAKSKMGEQLIDG